jgi:hypothetical protein
MSLVERWATSAVLPVGDKPIERHEHGYPDAMRPLIRNLLLNALYALPVGSGCNESEFAAWFADAYPVLVSPRIVHQLVAEARFLGVVDEGLVSLTPLARAWLTGEDLGEVVGRGPTEFIVQADHTVIAPPDLDPEVASVLSQIAQLESTAGAHTYRIDDRSLLSALDSGSDAEQMLSFLAEHSSTPVPQVVARTVTDAAARHGSLSIGSASTWVASEDPTVISRAIAVKAAKLTLVSPTVAVSDHPRTKVMTALRAAGLVPLESGSNREPAKSRAHIGESPPGGGMLATDVDDIARSVWDSSIRKADPYELMLRELESDMSTGDWLDE